MRSSLWADAVGHDRVELAGEIERVAVREVAAVRQVHAEHRVARLQQRHVDRHVRLRAGVRLHVDVVGAEQRLGARDGQRARRRRRTRSRRSSGGPDTLRRTCSSSPSRRLRGPPRLTKFSDAISSRPSFCRWSSWRMASATSGSASASVRHIGMSVVSVGMNQFTTDSTLSPRSRRDLIDPALVAAAVERRFSARASGSRRRGRPRRCVRPSRGRWRRCARARVVPCTGRCTGRRGCPAPCWRRSARPVRCRRARSRGRRAPSTTARADREADRRVVHRRLAVGAVIVDAVAKTRRASA